MHIMKISLKVNGVGLTIRLRAAIFSIQVFTTTVTNANADLVQSNHRQSCSVQFRHSNLVNTLLSLRVLQSDFALISLG